MEYMCSISQPRALSLIGRRDRLPELGILCVYTFLHSVCAKCTHTFSVITYDGKKGVLRDNIVQQCRPHEHLIPLPIAMNTPNVPPVCSIVFPSKVSSSRPRRPYRIPPTVPNIAPVLIPTANPIIAPNFILSKQLDPRECLCCTGGIASKFSFVAREVVCFNKNVRVHGPTCSVGAL